MVSLGEYLRQERERRGITIEQLQESTKIRSKYLRAMEDGNFSEIPGEVYLKGFLRSYAEGIGLSGSDVLDRYALLKSEQGFIDRGDQRKPQGDSTMGPSVADRAGRGTRTGRNDRRRARGMAIAVTGLLLAALGSFVILNAVMGDGTSTKSASTITDDNPIPAHEPTRNKPGSTSDDTGRAVPAVDPAPKKAEAPVTVSLSGIVRSWVKVAVDGTPAYQGFLGKDEQREWSGNATIELTMTNAGGVSVTHNGTRLGALGDTGQFMTRVFKPSIRAATTTPKPEPKREAASEQPRRERVGAEPTVPSITVAPVSEAVVAETAKPSPTSAVPVKVPAVKPKPAPAKNKVTSPEPVANPVEAQPAEAKPEPQPDPTPVSPEPAPTDPTGAVTEPTADGTATQ